MLSKNVNYSCVLKQCRSNYKKMKTIPKWVEIKPNTEKTCRHKTDWYKSTKSQFKSRFKKIQSTVKQYDFRCIKRQTTVSKRLLKSDQILHQNLKDLVKTLIFSSHDILFPARSLLLQQSQDFLDNHLARVPLIPNQQGTLQMRDKMISSGVAQEVDTNEYQVSDLEEEQFQSKYPELKLVTVSRPGLDTRLHLYTLKIFEMGSVFDISVLFDDKEQRTFSSVKPSRWESQWSTQLQNSQTFRTRTEIFFERVHRTLFASILTLRFVFSLKLFH